MNKKMICVASALLGLGLLAAAAPAVQSIVHGPPAAGAAFVEMSQFCGQNRLQIELHNRTKLDVADRRIVVRTLDLADPRLRDSFGHCVVTDLRVPASGTVLVNGVAIPMVTDVLGRLSASVPAASVNWFGVNVFRVHVYDAHGAQIWEFGLRT